MRLSITTYGMLRDWDLDALCRELPKAGVEGVEFRISQGHGHGVELDSASEERRSFRDKLDESGLCACSLATGFRFDSPEPDTVRENVEGVKKTIELASDLGVSRIRVFGNAIPEGAEPDDIAIQVGKALRELAPIGERSGVDILLEMHGDFDAWWLAREAVEFANHRAVGIVYNCDRRDIVDGSVASVFHEVKALIRHVHFHDLSDKQFPYEELFFLLARDGYSGYMSMEMDPEGDAVENLDKQAGTFFRLRESALQML